MATDAASTKYETAEATIDCVSEQLTQGDLRSDWQREASKEMRDACMTLPGLMRAPIKLLLDTAVFADGDDDAWAAATCAGLFFKSQRGMVKRLSLWLDGVKPENMRPSEARLHDRSNTKALAAYKSAAATAMKLHCHVLSPDMQASQILSGIMAWMGSVGMGGGGGVDEKKERLLALLKANKGMHDAQVDLVKLLALLRVIVLVLRAMYPQPAAALGHTVFGVRYTEDGWVTVDGAQLGKVFLRASLTELDELGKALERRQDSTALVRKLLAAGGMPPSQVTWTAAQLPPFMYEWQVLLTTMHELRVRALRYSDEGDGGENFLHAFQDALDFPSAQDPERSDLLPEWEGAAACLTAIGYAEVLAGLVQHGKSFEEVRDLLAELGNSGTFGDCTPLDIGTLRVGGLINSVLKRMAERDTAIDPMARRYHGQLLTWASEALLHHPLLPAGLRQDIATNLAAIRVHIDVSAHTDYADVAVGELTPDDEAASPARPGVLDILANYLDLRAQESFYELLHCNGSLGALRLVAREGRDWVDGIIATQLDVRLRGLSKGTATHQQQQQQVGKEGEEACHQPVQALLERYLRCTRMTVTAETGWLDNFNNGGGGGGGEADVGAALAAALGLHHTSAVTQRIISLAMRLPVRAPQVQQQQGQRRGQHQGPVPVLSPQLPHALALAFPMLTHLALTGWWLLLRPLADTRREFFAGLARLTHLTSLRLDTLASLQHVGLLAAGCPCLRELSVGTTVRDPETGIVEWPVENVLWVSDHITAGIATALASLLQLRLLRLRVDLYSPSISTLLRHGLPPNLERLECYGRTSRKAPEYVLTACDRPPPAVATASSSGSQSGKISGRAGGDGDGGRSGGGYGGDGSSSARPWNVELNADMPHSDLMADHTVRAGICVHSFAISVLILDIVVPHPMGWKRIDLGPWPEDIPIRSLLRSCPCKSLGEVVCLGDMTAACAALNLAVPLLGPPAMFSVKGTTSTQQLLVGLLSLAPMVAEGITKLRLCKESAVTPKSAVEALRLLPQLTVVWLSRCPNLCTEAHARELAGCLAAAPEAVRVRRTVFSFTVGEGPNPGMAALLGKINRQLKRAGCGGEMVYRS